MPVIQCPGCKKKLKLKALREGAKVKCPGCAEVFQPTAEGGAAEAAAPAPKRKPATAKSSPARPAKKRPVKKKRPAPVDDFGDDYDDFGEDDFGGDDDYGQPARRPASGGRKAAKKKPAPKKSKTPLIIGLAVVAVAAIGGGAFFLMSGESEPGDTGANVADNGGNADGEHENENEGHGGNSGANGGGADGGGNDPGHGNNQQGNENRNAIAAAGGGNVSPTNSSPIDLQWLPSTTEAIVHVKVPQLMEGPLGAFLKDPNMAPQVQQFQAMAGFGPENIDSLTIGVSRISQMSEMQKEPNPETVSLIAVVRANTPLDPSKLLMIAPGAAEVTEGSMTYYRIPQQLPVAVWMPNPQTVVVGVESVVQQVAAGTGGTSTLDTGLLDGQSSIEIAFSPAVPDAIFRHPNFKLPENSPAPIPPPVRTLVASMKEHVVGAAIGITLTQDLAFRTAFRCRDEAGATQFAETFKTVSDELQKLQDPAAGGQGFPPQMQMMMAPFKTISDDMNKSFTVSSNGTLATTTSEAAGGGQTLSNFVPLAATMLGQSMQSGRSAAQTVRSRNNMKQMGLAMLNFHDVWKRFPNSTGKGPNGEEWLSWRVHLLPYLGHKELYDRFNLEEPWDGPTNRPLVESMPDVYKSPTVQTPTGKTVYLVPVGPGTMFENEKGRAIRTIPDGTSNTVMLIEAEASKAVYWSQPADFELDTANPLAGLAKNPRNALTVLMVDGSTRDIPPDLDTQTANNLFQVADGNAINLP